MLSPVAALDALLAAGCSIELGPDSTVIVKGEPPPPEILREIRTCREQLLHYVRYGDERLKIGDSPDVAERLARGLLRGGMEILMAGVQGGKLERYASNTGQLGGRGRRGPVDPAIAAMDAEGPIAPKR